MRTARLERKDGTKLRAVGILYLVSSPSRSISLDQHVLTARLFHFTTANEDMFDLRRELKGISAPDYDVRVFARLQRAKMVAQSEDFRWGKRDRAQSVIVRHPVSDGVAGFKLDVASIEARLAPVVVSNQYNRYTCAPQQRGVFLSLVQGSKA